MIYLNRLKIAPVRVKKNEGKVSQEVQGKIKNGSGMYLRIIIRISAPLLRQMRHVRKIATILTVHVFASNMRHYIHVEQAQ